MTYKCVLSGICMSYAAAVRNGIRQKRRLRILPDRLRFFPMTSKHFLHPDHMIPSAELTAAVMKLACFCIAHAGMEIHTVPGQVFVLGFRIADTGIKVQNPHLFQGIFQRPVQLSADPLFFRSASI